MPKSVFFSSTLSFTHYFLYTCSISFRTFFINLFQDAGFTNKKIQAQMYKKRMNDLEVPVGIPGMHFILKISGYQRQHRFLCYLFWHLYFADN